MNMMFKILSATLLSVGFSSLMAVSSHAAMTPNFTAKIYDLKDHSKHMFDYKSEFELNGTTKTYFNTISDLQGEVLVQEKTVMSVDGERETLVSFEQDQKQLGTKGRIEIRDGKVNFTFVKDGKTKTDDEDLSPDFVVTSTLVKFVQENWSGLMAGGTLKVRLGVLDRIETVGFQFKKEREKELGGAPGLVLKMKASSVIISAIVNPIYFGFSADGKRLFEIEGRTAVKVKVDGKFKDFDGYTVYAYPETAAPVPAVAEPVKPQKKPKSKK